jgi:hypothetical protein
MEHALKATTILLCLALLVLVGYVYAQRFPTNDVSQAQAIQIASRLWVGMAEDDVVKVVEKQNGLKSGGSAGSPIGGWTRFYLLSNGCFLDLQIEPKQRGSNNWLRSASVQSNAVKIFSIPLTNAP